MCYANQILWSVHTAIRYPNSIVLYCLKHSTIVSNSWSVVGFFFCVSDSFLDQYATGPPF